MTEVESDIADKLQQLGAVHAPVQKTEGDQVGHGREVTLRDPPAIYYLLGSDVTNHDGNCTNKVQLIFLGKQDQRSIGKPPYLTAQQVGEAAMFASRACLHIGYAIEKIEGLVSDQGSIPSAILAPWR